MCSCTTIDFFKVNIRMTIETFYVPQWFIYPCLWRLHQTEVASHCLPLESHTHSLHVVPPVVQVQLRLVGSAPIMFFKTHAHVHTSRQTKTNPLQLR